MSDKTAQGVAEVMEIARRLTFADTESVLSAETEGWWAKHDKACAIAKELEEAITAVIVERDILRARVSEVSKSYAWDTAALYAKLYHEAKARVAELERDAPQGVAEVMHLVEKYASDTADFVLVGSPVSSCEPIEQAITAIITERDALRKDVKDLQHDIANYVRIASEHAHRVSELGKDAERYQFWRNRWGDEQFLSTLAGTIRQLSDPLIRGDYNNLDIVSDAAIAASKEAP